MRTTSKTTNHIEQATLPAVDIVIPVWNAAQETKACVESVLAHRPENARIVIVDDASTDRSLTEYLHETASSHRNCLVLRNEKNTGFVASANRGLTQSSENDVLLLNSDTVVAPGFIEGLQRCAYRQADTGVVSPLSNNATICSVPIMCANNPLPENLHSLNKALQQGRPRYPQIPTAVGFCMYIKRTVISAIGLFDLRFGKGFGEENDFCERAKTMGFSIRLCDDVYVSHIGRASFQAEGSTLLEANQQILYQRYPHYRDEIVSFMRINPLRDVQQRIASLLASTPSHPESSQHSSSDYPKIIPFNTADSMFEWCKSLRFRSRVHIIGRVVFSGEFPEDSRSKDVSSYTFRRNTLQLVSGGRDPGITLRSVDISSQRVSVIRVRMRSQSTRVGVAQLYFAHAPHDAFQEENSIIIPLPEHGTYTEIWLDLRNWSGLSRLQTKPTIRKLRFDPLSSPGQVWLKDISFGRYKSHAVRLHLDSP